MSSSIWTRCAGAEELCSLRCEAWRMVEAQHRVSTLKLVDTLEEQAALEELIDRAKPRFPSMATRRNLHYLLKTPFRYPPLRYGSRFGTRFETGIWYGALAEATVLAEVAYYRLLFIEDTTADLGHVATEHTSFRVKIATERGIDLTQPPFDAFSSRLSSKTSYAPTQPLGTAMRTAGVEAFTFLSARDPSQAHNLGIFDPAAFVRTVPLGTPRTWHCLATRDQVIFSRRGALRQDPQSFPRTLFERKGRLARVVS